MIPFLFHSIYSYRQPPLGFGPHVEVRPHTTPKTDSRWGKYRVVIGYLEARYGDGQLYFQECAAMHARKPQIEKAINRLERWFNAAQARTEFADRFVGSP